MDERCTQIVHRLIESKKPLTISELSCSFNVSNRTIRYDLDKIDNYLKENGLSKLIRQPNSGIQVKDSVDIILSKFKGIDTYEYVMTGEERQKLILAELLLGQQYVTIQSLADLLSVSRGTVVNDVKTLDKFLLENNLCLKSSTRHGIKIDGDERTLRDVLISMISEDIRFTTADDNMNTYKYHSTNIISDKIVKKLLQNMNINRIYRMIRAIEKALGIIFSDKSFSLLFLKLALSIPRIKSGMHVTLNPEELKDLKQSKEFNILTSISSVFKKKIGFEVTEDEIGYIVIDILGAEASSNDTYLGEYWMELEIITAKIIEIVQEKIGITLNTDDELYKGLKDYLRRSIYRLKHKILLKNHLLEDIKENHLEIYNVVKYSVNPLESYSNCRIPDDEIGNITMYFIAAIEKFNSNLNRKYKVIIVCGIGIGTAKMLTSRIKSEFSNFDIITTTTVHQVKETLLGKGADFIISTVPTYSTILPEIVVNPILGKNDIIKINNFIYSYKPVVEDYDYDGSTLVDDILKTIEKNCIIVSKEKLVRELNSIKGLPTVKVLKEGGQPMLKDILTQENIMVNIIASDWEDAVRIGGEILVNNGAINKSYIDAMIGFVKEMGPYIVIAPGIAMPHARPEDGVNRVCMSLITLQKPIEFGNAQNDPVDLVICLGAIDNSTHLRALSDLMSLLGNETKLNQIRQAKNPEEITKIISDID